MFVPCPRCRHSFVPGEPFVRAETLGRCQEEPGNDDFRSVESGYFHLHCAPWGDPKFRITRPEREPIAT